MAATVLASVAAVFAQAPPAPRDGAGSVHVWPVQRNIYALFGPGGNVTVSVGEEGVLVVDAMTAQAAPDVIAAIKTISSKPIPARSHVGDSYHMSNMIQSPSFLNTSVAFCPPRLYTLLTATFTSSSRAVTSTFSFC